MGHEYDMIIFLNVCGGAYWILDYFFGNIILTNFGKIFVINFVKIIFLDFFVKFRVKMLEKNERVMSKKIR